MQRQMEMDENEAAQLEEREKEMRQLEVSRFAHTCMHIYTPSL